MTDKLTDYISSKYKNILSEKEMEQHIKDYVGLDIAKINLETVLRNGSAISTILDIGCGFGSFVLCANIKGLDAIGMDIADFEIKYAKERLKKYLPGHDNEYVYRMGSGTALPFKAGSFDVVTLWNTLEHVREYKRMLQEAYRVLKSGGELHIVCPNYCSFRNEAHYHLFWPPYFPKALARFYLRIYGKDPMFLDNDIFYVSNWGVLRALRKTGFIPHDIRREKLMKPDLIKNTAARYLVNTVNRIGLSWLPGIFLSATFYNPFKQSICLYAKKREAGKP